ncbi:hypothetical protein SynROS8604_03329 [Synechococcus sp. ROS8604]|nr:hypothetical protein SynROS8604_03329 [Synechococcus sp. ROS8604]
MILPVQTDSHLQGTIVIPQGWCFPQDPDPSLKTGLKLTPAKSQFHLVLCSFTRSQPVQSVRPA